MNCTICHKPIKLIPSAAHRASVDNDPSHNAAYYTKLFPTHAACEIEKREAGTRELIKRHYV
jgi:hypothetical protein